MLVRNWCVCGGGPSTLMKAHWGKTSFTAFPPTVTDTGDAFWKCYCTCSEFYNYNQFTWRIIPTSRCVCYERNEVFESALIRAIRAPAVEAF